MSMISELDSEVIIDQPLIEVLLATCNGEKYLSQQLASLAEQTWSNVLITVSDDGSTDGTRTILQQFASVYGEKVQLLQNTWEKGVVGNFAFLMAQSTGDYVAFCDQDDVWDRDKLAKMMSSMKEIETSHGMSLPILLYSDMRLIDDRNITLAESLWKKAGVTPRKASFRNLLAQNLVTGCTTLANRSLLLKAQPLPALSCIMMHDYWLALVAMSFGVCKPLEFQAISYRQHDTNVVGAGRRLTTFQRFMRIFSDTELNTWISKAAKQAGCFSMNYDKELTPKALESLRTIESLSSKTGLARAWIMLREGITRTGFLNQLQFVLRLAFGTRNR